MDAAAIIIVVSVLLIAAGGICYYIARRQRRAVAHDMNSIENLCKERPALGEAYETPLPYTIHHNHFMGGWLQMTTRAGFKSYDVFDVKLRDVDFYLEGKMHGWNRKYKAAQQIYGDTQAAQVVRSGIHAEHQTLYREVGVERTTKGAIDTAARFIALIRGGIDDGSQTFFTYVILPDGTWRFSTTGKEKLRDGLSKHAVHANAATELSYAGEFHFDVPTMTLVLDNNSGTFAPDKADLDKVRRLFAANLPGINVSALDREDPKLVVVQERIYNKGNAPTRGTAASPAASAGPTAEEPLLPRSEV